MPPELVVVGVVVVVVIVAVLVSITVYTTTKTKTPEPEPEPEPPAPALEPAPAPTTFAASVATTPQYTATQPYVSQPLTPPQLKLKPTTNTAANNTTTNTAAKPAAPGAKKPKQQQPGPTTPTLNNKPKTVAPAPAPGPAPAKPKPQPQPKPQPEQNWNSAKNSLENAALGYVRATQKTSGELTVSGTKNVTPMGFAGGSRYRAIVEDTKTRTQYGVEMRRGYGVAMIPTAWSAKLIAVNQPTQGPAEPTPLDSPPKQLKPGGPPPSVPPSPGPQPAMKGTFPDKFSAPYVDTSAQSSTDACPAKYAMLAFVLAGSDGAPAWNGTDPIKGMAYCTNLIARLRSGGGDAIVSFGGAAGTELAHKITDPAKLATAYGSVVDALKLRWADFDIEGASIEDRTVVARRMAAIKLLQAKYPSLIVSFTLPVMPTGLIESGIAFIKAAVAAGVRTDVVNVMCMNYGESFKGDQGAHAIAAAKATRAQLVAAGMPNAKIGITPMIGTNDTAVLVFTLEHARAVAAFARATPWVRMLSFWSVGRDNASGGVGSPLSNSSSGVAQKPWDFTRALTM